MGTTDKRAMEAQKALNSVARKLDRSMHKVEAQKTSELIGILQGMKDLAKKIGIHCSCSIRTVEQKGTGVTTGTSCICASSAKGLRQKYLRRKEGLEMTQQGRRSVVVHQFEGKG